MATRKKPKKKEKLNASNAMQVANRGMNPAFTQSQTQKVKGEDGKWHDGDAYTQSVKGKLSTDGRRAGGSTWTFTQKDENGNKIRQSGRSQIATRRQRYYDVRVGLGLAGG